MPNNNKNKKKNKKATAAATALAENQLVAVAVAVAVAVEAVEAVEEEDKVATVSSIENCVVNSLPFVSICTPTYNRRPFIDAMIKCFLHQDYPQDKMEWIIVDDGTDKVGDLLANLPFVKYIPLEKQLVLGAKRNMLHDHSKGDIIVYMDDDDYYPPERVSHAVSMLQSNPNVLCAGSSCMHIYFKHLNEIYRFGPYGPKHATAGTMAFKRALLDGGKHRYDDTAALAEEKAFLKNYTVPFIQLDSLKTILVFSHDHNTFDKKRLLEGANPQYVNKSSLKVADFIKDLSLQTFYLETMYTLLESYPPGRPNMKPAVLKQMISIEKTRRKQLQEIQQQNMNNSNSAGGVITFKNGDGPPQTLTMPQIVDILQKQQMKIVELSTLLVGKDAEIQMLQTELLKTKK